MRLLPVHPDNLRLNEWYLLFTKRGSWEWVTWIGTRQGEVRFQERPPEPEESDMTRSSMAGAWQEPRRYSLAIGRLWGRVFIWDRSDDDSQGGRHAEPYYPPPTQPVDRGDPGGWETKRP